MHSRLVTFRGSRIPISQPEASVHLDCWTGPDSVQWRVPSKGGGVGGRALGKRRCPVSQKKESGYSHIES